MVPSCAEGGVLGVLCGVVGSVQAAEAVKLVTGAGEPLVGRLLVHDALRQTWDSLPVRRDASCALCGDAPTVTDLQDYQAFCGMPAALGRGDAPPVEEVTAADLCAILSAAGAQGPPQTVVVDVRTDAERSVVSIPGALAVGMDQFRSGAALSLVPAGRPVVLYCASGVRSAEASAILLRGGRDDVRSLRGGIHAWLRYQEHGAAVR